MKYLFIIIFTCLYSIGCSENFEDDSSNVIQLFLPEQNPTSYVFDFSRNEIKTRIYKYINNYRATDDYLGLRIYSEWGHFDSLDCRHIKINEKDLDFPRDTLKYGYLLKEDYFHIETGNYIPYSKLYRSEDGGQVHYYAHYILRLIPLSETRTEVSVITGYTEILLGEYGVSKCSRACGGHAFLITRFVPPSTIEEYEKLLKIGELLGVKDKMPPIKYALDEPKKLIPGDSESFILWKKIFYLL